MSLTVAFHADLWRVSLAGADWDAERVHIERSTNGLVWHTVRGGRRRPVEGGAWWVDDFEYAPGVENIYRVTDVDDAAEREQATITPAHDRIVLKHVEYPALNRPITVVDWTTPTRAGRTSLHEVRDRPDPISVSGAMASPAFELVLMTETAEQARDLELALAVGGVLLAQGPAGCQVPTGYVVALGVEGPQRATRSGRGERRYWTVSCRRTSAPDADVQTALLTWHTLATVYGSWEQVWAAHPTWLDLWQTVVDPSEVLPI